MNTHPLSRLIQSVEDGQGWTDREVSRRISAAGHSMSHSYIGKLKNKPIQSVNASMVQTLAIGLGLPETVVAEAALASMGVHIDTSSNAGLDVAIATEEDLTDRDKRLLRSLVKEMRTDGHGHETGRQPDESDAQLARQPQRDGSTTVPDDTAHRPLPEGVWGLAASRGPRGREEMDRRAAEAGEESQIPEG